MQAYNAGEARSQDKIKIFNVDNYFTLSIINVMEALSPAPHVVMRKFFNVLDELRRASLKATNATQEKKLLGLTFRQGSALWQVKTMTEKVPQGIALKTLASHMQMTVPATSLLVESMVEKGLFERTPNPDDRRAVCIRLSEKGLQICEEVNANLNARIDALFGHISSANLEQMSRFADDLQRRLYGGETEPRA